MAYNTPIKHHFCPVRSWLTDMNHINKNESTLFIISDFQKSFFKLEDLLAKDSLLDIIIIPQEKKLDLLYSGIDLTDSAIALAKQKHPEATFQCQDLFSLSYSESERPDYVLASGTFNAIPADTPSPQALLESAIEKMFLLSKKGISLTFKTRSDSAGSTLHLAAYDPVKVFQYARSLSDYAQINHSFSTQFCSLFIYK